MYIYISLKVQHIAAPSTIIQVDAMSSKNRLSVNLAGNEYQQLLYLSKELDVSMAWIGRQAIIQLLEKNGTKSSQQTLFDLKAIKEAR